MQQISTFFYKVSPGESITISVTPNKVGAFVAAAIAGSVLQNVGGNTPTFKFNATDDPDHSHIDVVKMVFNFPGTLDPQAKYVVKVSGSGNENFNGPTVNKSDPLHAPNLNFIVGNQ